MKDEGRITTPPAYAEAMREFDGIVRRISTRLGTPDAYRVNAMHADGYYVFRVESGTQHVTTWMDDPREVRDALVAILNKTPETMPTPICHDCGTSLQSAAYDVNATRCRVCLGRIVFGNSATIGEEPEGCRDVPDVETRNTAQTTRFILDPETHTLLFDVIMHHETYAGGIEALSIVEKHTVWTTSRPAPDTLAVFQNNATYLYVVESMRDESTVPDHETIPVYGIDQLSSAAAKHAIAANWDELEACLPRHQRLSAEVARQCSAGIPLDRAISDSYDIMLDRMGDLFRESGAVFTLSGQRIQ